MLNSLRRVFGCWHLELGRPFTDQGKTYRVCLKCSAHLRFNPDSWKTVGDRDDGAAPEAKPDLIAQIIHRVLRRS